MLINPFMVCVAVSTFGLSGPKWFGSDVVWSSDMLENRVSDVCSVVPSLMGKRKIDFIFWWITTTLRLFQFTATRAQDGAQAVQGADNRPSRSCDF